MYNIQEYKKRVKKIQDDLKEQENIFNNKNKLKLINSDIARLERLNKRCVKWNKKDLIKINFLKNEKKKYENLKLELKEDYKLYKKQANEKLNKLFNNLFLPKFRITFNDLNENLNEYNLIKLVISYVNKNNRGNSNSITVLNNYYQKKYSKIVKENPNKYDYITFQDGKFYFKMEDFWLNERLSFKFIWRFKDEIKLKNLKLENYNLTKIQLELINFHFKIEKIKY